MLLLKLVASFALIGGLFTWLSLCPILPRKLYKIFISIGLPSLVLAAVLAVIVALQEIWFN